MDWIVDTLTEACEIESNLKKTLIPDMITRISLKQEKLYRKRSIRLTATDGVTDSNL